MGSGHRQRFEVSSAPNIAPIIFVIHRDPSVQASLELLIRGEGWHPKTFDSARAFIAHPRVTAPSCLLAELDSQTSCGLDLQRRLSERMELPIIFMCGHIDVPTAVRAIRAGALEILTKPLAAVEVIDAVRQAIDRSRAVLNHLAQVQGLKERFASLSAREREVMSLLVSGRLNKQVGFDLGISEITVKKHRGRLMHKMRARSFAELMTMMSSLHRWTSEMTEITHFACKTPPALTPSHTRMTSFIADLLPQRKPAVSSLHT